MNHEPTHILYGYSASEAIAMFPGELETDAVGLWQIVPNGRDGFQLVGLELESFIRRSINALLDEGAYPVRHIPGSDFEWNAQSQYGSTRELVVDAIIAEWKALPDDPLVLCGEGVWFARPKLGTKYVKLD